MSAILLQIIFSYTVFCLDLRALIGETRKVNVRKYLGHGSLKKWFLELAINNVTTVTENLNSPEILLTTSVI